MIAQLSSWKHDQFTQGPCKRSSAWGLNPGAQLIQEHATSHSGINTEDTRHQRVAVEQLSMMEKPARDVEE